MYQVDYDWLSLLLYALRISLLCFANFREKIRQLQLLRQWFSIFTLLLAELWMGLFVKLHRFYLHIEILDCSLVQLNVQDVELGNQIVSFLVGLLG